MGSCQKTAIKTNQLQSLIWREGIEEEGWDNKFEKELTLSST